MVSKLTAEKQALMAVVERMAADCADVELLRDEVCGYVCLVGCRAL